MPPGDCHGRNGQAGQSVQRRGAARAAAGAERGGPAAEVPAVRRAPRAPAGGDAPAPHRRSCQGTAGSLVIISVQPLPSLLILCLVQVVQADFDPLAAPQSRAEPKQEPFGPYHSPLLVFKSYRSGSL